MKKETKKYANTEHYEQVHAYLLAKDETKGEVNNAFIYKDILATQGLEVSIYDCKQWISSLGSKADITGFKLK